jgi:hypothetical protein
MSKNTIYINEAEAQRNTEEWLKKTYGTGRAGNNNFSANLAKMRTKQGSSFQTIREIGGKVAKAFSFVNYALEQISGPPLGQGTYTGEAVDKDLGTPIIRQPKAVTNTITNNYYVSGPGNDYSTQTVVYIPVYPPRKLRPKLDAIDTVDSKDVRQPVITAEQSFSKKKWGQILHQPVTNGTLKILEWDGTDYLNWLSNNRVRSEQRLNDWLLNGTPIKLHEQSVVFIDNYNFDTQTKKLSQFSGINSIQALYDLYYVKSQIQFNGVIDAIPKEVKIQKQKIQKASYEQDNFYYQNTRGGMATRTAGSEAFPISVPSVLAGEDKGIELIYTMPELLIFILKMQDNLQGQFPIEIEIEDTNLQQSGNQSKKVTLYNMSECLAEIYGMGVNTQIYQQLLTNLATTNLAHTTQAIISSNVTQDYARGNADFLGWQRNEIEREMDLPYNTNSQSFSELLNHSKAKYGSIDNTDPKDLNDYLVFLMDAASIIKGSLFKKMPSDKEGIKKYLLDRLKSMNPSGKTPDDQWDDFIRKVETGFSTESGSSVKTPYNRNFEERPKVRDTTSGN